MVDELDLAAAGLPGGGTQFLIRFDPDRMSRDGLESRLMALHPGVQSALRISSDAGAGTLAAAAGEAAGGLVVGLNWVFQPTDFASAFTVEAPVGDAGFNSNPLVYGGDAYDWTHLRAGTRQDTGVTLAWTQLDAAGRLANRVVIGVHDQGLRPIRTSPRVERSTGRISRARSPAAAEACAPGTGRT